MLCTTVCGTGLFPQHCAVDDFHMTKMVMRKCFVPQTHTHTPFVPGLYQLRKGTSTGLALIYFYIILGEGRRDQYIRYGLVYKRSIQKTFLGLLYRSLMYVFFVGLFCKSLSLLPYVQF